MLHQYLDRQKHLCCWQLMDCDRHLRTYQQTKAAQGAENNASGFRSPLDPDRPLPPEQGCASNKLRQKLQNLTIIRRSEVGFRPDPGII